jgi:nitrite reductase/ring-hydroxylating ferredoxin subunit
MRQQRANWHIAMASQKLARGPQACRIGKLDLALWRDDQGRPAALLDRCPHRNVPLSQGRVEQDAVRCVYHGWGFAADGACVLIPSLPEGRPYPPGCAATSFACIEQDEYIWVWTGADRPAEGPRPFGRPAHAAWLQGRSMWKCDWRIAVENAMDPVHAAYAHPGLHPQAIALTRCGPADVSYEMESALASLILRTPAPSANAANVAPPPAEVTITFLPPDRIVLERPRERVFMVMHFVDLVELGCRVEWLVQAFGMPAGVHWSDTEPEIFRQDRAIVEGIDRCTGGWQDRNEVNVPADAATILLRRLMAGKTHATARKVIRYRGT